MKKIDDKGIALVTVLVLSAIALIVMAGLIYMIIIGTQTSGIIKRYKTAVEAGIGGVDITTQLIAARGNNPFDATITNLLKFTITNQNCLNDKMINKTENWSECDASKAKSITINNSDPQTYDVSFELGLSPTYKVFAKIVDTVEGNSGGVEGLIKGGVVESNPGEVSVMSIPYLYTIEVNAERKDNPTERAKLSVLYEY